MILLLILLATFGGLGVGYTAGVMRAREVDKSERAELRSLRELRTTLFRMGSRQAAVGDPFAMQVTDEITNQIGKTP